MTAPRLLPLLACTFVAAASATGWASAPSTAAPVAVEATLLGRRSDWRGGTIITRSLLRIDHVMRGAAPAQIEVTELGGRIGDIAQIVHGWPAMPAGPRVAVELWPTGAAWKLGHVLVPASSGAAPAEVVAVGATNYVRATNKDSDPPCDGALKNVFWATADVHWALDATCSSDVDTDACEAAVRASFQTWQDVACAYITFSYDGRLTDAPLGYNASGSNINVVKWIEFDWMGSPEAQALTLSTVGCATGRQYDSDIWINGENSTFTVAPMIGGGQVDIQNTITHEVGHLAGFAHSADSESTMFFTASIDETKKRDLTADDEMGLCAVYPVGHEPGHDSGGCGCAAGGSTGRVGVLTGGAMTAALLGLAALRGRRRRRAEAGRPRG